MADEVVAAGKSREEIAYKLMRDLMFNSSDGVSEPTKADYIKHFVAARMAVYGAGNATGILSSSLASLK